MQYSRPKILGKAPRAFAIAAGLAMLFASARASAESFRKYPYLQGLSRDGVQIRFELPKSAPATIEILGPDESRRVIEANDAKAFHDVRIDGLLPATAYRYTVRASGMLVGGTFTTAPDDARPFSFLVYGDSRTDPAAHAGIVQGMLKTPSDFLVGTGDLVARGDDPRDWDIFFTIERKLLADRCLFSAIGNHELIGIGREGRIPFLDYFSTGVDSGEPRLYDTFRWSNSRFFVLSAMEDWTGPERDWLARELEKAESEEGLDHRFAVLHIGPWTSGPHGPNKRMHEAGIPELLRKHRVELVFSGHDHLYERGEVDGLKYMVSGGAGAPLYRVKHHLSTTEKVESTHHWVEVSVDGPTVRTRAVRLDGSLIESCSYETGKPWICEGPEPKKTSETERRAGAPVALAGTSPCACSLPGLPAGRNEAALAALALGLALGLRRLV